MFLIADISTSWILFESKTYDAYHEYMVSNLNERPELSIPELQAENFTREDILRLSKGFTFPVVIRGVLVNSSGVKEWANSTWWIDNYSNEGILCGTLNNVRPECTVKDFFDEIQNNNSFYISGASKIFDRHPQLAEMVEDGKLKTIEPGERVTTQIFMGLKDMGSDIHAAMGVNIFRQIVGVKKWWFIPPSQTAYLKPSLNVNGFSAHTHTLVGKDGEQESPWMSKLERYTSTLYPGDVLINPPWFWHGILNLGDQSSDLVIGVPTRYNSGSVILTAFRSNPILTALAVAVVFYNNARNGFQSFGDVEDKIQANRVARMVNSEE